MFLNGWTLFDIFWIVYVPAGGQIKRVGLMTFGESFTCKNWHVMVDCFGVWNNSVFNSIYDKMTIRQVLLMPGVLWNPWDILDWQVCSVLLLRGVENKYGGVVWPPPWLLKHGSTHYLILKTCQTSNWFWGV